MGGGHLHKTILRSAWLVTCGEWPQPFHWGSVGNMRQWGDGRAAAEGGVLGAIS
jgi:hypothetical protein